VRRTIWAGTVSAVIGAVLAVPGPAAAARPDTRPPTVPANVAATAVTQTSITLSWSRSTDNVRVVSYVAWAPGTPLVWTDGPRTTVTLTGLKPGTTYEVRVHAFDGIQSSPPSPILPVTTRPDILPPSAPTQLRLGDRVNDQPVDSVTASAALLVWTNAGDDFGPLTYRVLVDGVPSPDVHSTRPAGSPTTAASAAWVRHLRPGTTHTLTVQAFDAGGNASPVSGPLTVTTDPNPDTVAPTAPRLTTAFSGGTGICPEELWVRWQTSTDDSDGPAAIEYEVRVNGTINEVVPAGGRTITYTEINGANVVTIVAVDPAGNASAPSNGITVPVSWGADCVG
jgi:hypothetical protein